MSDDTRFKARFNEITWYRTNVPCMEACPVHTDSGRYVQLIAEGRHEEAFLVARSPNPLASVCGRICHHPCEGECNRQEIDQPRAAETPSVKPPPQPITAPSPPRAAMREGT